MTTTRPSHRIGWRLLATACFALAAFAGLAAIATAPSWTAVGWGVLLAGLVLAARGALGLAWRLELLDDLMSDDWIWRARR